MTMVGASEPYSFADLEARYGSFYTPTFEIDVDGGQTFSPAAGRASSVKVQTAVERFNRVSFSVAGVYDQADGDFVGLEDSGLTVGTDITVKIGYEAQAELPTVMTGTITDVNPNFPSGSAPTVDVVGHDHRYSMDQTTGDDSWEESTVEAVAESIADSYDFERASIGNGGPGSAGTKEMELKRLVKEAESDFSYMKQLITKYDYEMFSRGGVLYFRRPPEKQGNPSATVELQYGKGLRSFQRTGGTAQSQVTTVEATGVDHSTGDSVSGSAKRDVEHGQGADERRLLKAGFESDTEAEKQAESEDTSLGRQQRSSATTIGLPVLQIGDWVKLTGLGSVSGQEYDGLYYLLSVDHSIERNGYTTNLTMTGPKSGSSE